MPVIPNYQQRTRSSSAGVTQPVARNTPNAMGDVGQIVSQIGENVTRAAQAETAVWAADKLSGLQSKWQTEYLTRSQNAEAGAPEFTGTLLKDFDTDVAENLKTAPNAMAKRYIQERSNAFRDNLTSQSMRFEAESRVNHSVNTAATAVDRYANELRSNPTVFADRLQEFDTLVSGMNIPGDDREKLQLTARSKLASFAVEGVIASSTTPEQLAALTKQLMAEPGKSGSDVIEALTPEERSQSIKLIANQAIKAKNAQNDGIATSLVSTYGQQGPEIALAELQKQQSVLSPDDYQDVLAKFNSGTASVRAQKQTEYADTFSSVYTALSTDSATKGTLGQVETLWNSGALTATEYASLTGRVQENRKKQADDAAKLQSVQVLLDGGLPLDPTDTNHMKALSAAFVRDSSGLAPGSPQWRDAALAYGVKTSVLPKEASQWADRALRSNDPKLVAQAAEFVSLAENQTPTQAFDKYTKARADIINGQVSAGVAPPLAVAHADAIMKQDERVTEFRQKEYAKLTGPTGTSPQSMLESQISNDPVLSIGRNPDVSVHGSLLPDFDTMTRDYYTLTGDLKKSQQLAIADIKKVYGVSEVNGTKELALAPVEKFGLDPKEVRIDLEDWLKNNPQSDGSTIDDLIVVADAVTMKAVSGVADGQALQPSWSVINKSGVPVMSKSGVPQRFHLPEGEEANAIAAKRIAERAKNLKEAETINRRKAEQEQELRMRNEGLGYEGVGR